MKDDVISIANKNMIITAAHGLVSAMEVTADTTNTFMQRLGGFTIVVTSAPGLSADIFEAWERRVAERKAADEA